MHSPCLMTVEGSPQSLQSTYLLAGGSQKEPVGESTAGLPWWATELVEKQLLIVFLECETG